MDGRSYTLIIALVLAGSSLTGCIQSPDWFNANSAEVSAFDHKAAADDAALAWSPDAKLAGVMAFELSESPDPRIDADPDPGNGLAPAWWYVYCDEDGDADGRIMRAFKVAADGTVTSEKDAEAFAAGMDHDMATPLGEWKVDSDDALAAAKADEGFAKVAQGFNATVVEGVAHHEGRTTWWVSAMSADGFVVATVDAATGELLHVQPMGMDFAMPSFEWGSANPQLAGEPVLVEGEGTAARGDEPFRAPFSTSGPVHGTLAIDFSAQMPADGLHWEILDAEGERVAGDHLSSWRGQGERSYEAKLEVEEPGDYELTLFYMDSLGYAPLPSIPAGGSVEYAFVLDLTPGFADHDEDE